MSGGFFFVIVVVVVIIVSNCCQSSNHTHKRRDLDHVRPISCSTGMYDALHGSALFQRGQTQVLCSVTFDSPEAMYKSNIIHNMMSPSLTNFDKNFMLHYEVGDSSSSCFFFCYEWVNSIQSFHVLNVNNRTVSGVCHERNSQSWRSRRSTRDRSWRSGRESGVPAHAGQFRLHCASAVRGTRVERLVVYGVRMRRQSW